MNALSLKKHFYTSKSYTVLGSLRLPASEVRRRITGKLPEDTFFIISCSFLLRMRNVSEKKIVEQIKTHFLYSITLFENRAVYEIMWQNMVQRGRPQMKCGACALHTGYLRLRTHTQIT